jgi:8-oxo-dGTP diphosphatase/2-hydroxy-dATP diphosphatase
MKKRLLTLCFVHDHPRVLLGMKKRRFGAGLWNGFGGKVEEGEEIEEAAIRELKEESGLEALNISKRGVLTFEFENDPAVLEVHVFYTDKFQGKIIETDEMRPQWFHVSEIPYEDMWTDDKFWIPMMLEGKKFKGNFLLDRPSDKNYHAKIIRQDLVEVDEI